MFYTRKFSKYRGSSLVHKRTPTLYIKINWEKTSNNGTKHLECGYLTDRGEICIFDYDSSMFNFLSYKKSLLESSGKHCIRSMWKF